MPELPTTTSAGQTPPDRRPLVGDMVALTTEAAAFAEQVPLAEEVGVKLNRLLFGFVEAEVLPQATRAVEQGIDPTPLFDVVANVLRMYAGALERPDRGTY